MKCEDCENFKLKKKKDDFIVEIKDNSIHLNGIEVASMSTLRGRKNLIYLNGSYSFEIIMENGISYLKIGGLE